MSEHRGLTERTIAGAGWTFLGTGTQALMEVVALIVLARLLSPREFGIFAVALVVTGICTIFSELGVGPAIVQRPSLEQRHIRVAFTLSVILSLLVAALVVWTAPAIAGFFHMPELADVVRITSAAFVCHGIAAVAQALAQRELRFRWLAGVEAGAFTAGFVIAGPLLAWLGFGVWALVGANLIQQIVRMALLVSGQPHAKSPMLERGAIQELLYFGGGFSLARIGNFIAGKADKLVVGRWLGPQSLGLYVHAYQLMTAPAMLIGQVLDRVLFPSMALVQHEPERLARAYRSGVAVCATLILPASIVVAVVSPEIVLLLLGPAWAGVTLPLQILALGMLFRTSYKLSDSVARATGAVYARAWRQAIYAAAIVIGSLVGQLWGLGGVAAGVTAAIALNFILMAQLSLRLTGISWPEFWAAHRPAVALAAMLGAGAWMLAGYLRELQLTPFMLLLDVALCAAVAGLLLCRLLPAIFLGQEARSLLGMLARFAALMPQRSPVT